MPAAVNRQGQSATVPSLTPATFDPAGVEPPPAPDDEPEGDPVLLQRLQALRKTLAEGESLPAYCIVQNRTLQELALRRPTEPDALLQIYGIGKEKARKYGDVLLQEIRAHLAAGPMERGQA